MIEEPRQIPYQINPGGVVALLPDGRVEFLHPAVLPLIHRIDRGETSVDPCAFDDYVLTEPLVELDRFHLAAPAIAFIETTNLCNLRCKHCYAWSGYRRPDEISTVRILGILDEFAEIGVLQVFLTGGELFAHPDAVRIIQHARSKPFSTQIFTNGLLITEEKLAALPPATSFFISFDTADPVRTVRGGMDFPKLRQRFEWMKRYGHVFRTAISVHRQNIDDAEEIFEWCAANDYPRPQWLETHPIGRALLHPDILLRPEDVDRVVDVYARCMDRYAAPPEEQCSADGTVPMKKVGRMYSIQTIKFCQRLEKATGQEKCGRSIAYVNSAGDVFPCSNCMSNGMHRAGNLADRPFAEIWRDGFDEFRSHQFTDHDPCSTCPVQQAGIWCQFRCPPLATNVSGSPKGCGATEYLREFMLRTHRYWAVRRENGVRLTLRPTRFLDAGEPSSRGESSRPPQLPA